ncbi:hypothetical protein [Helicobacter sp. 11S02629-2]|uniref:hypothetical protein n=1 Tax=Helicobacter sp. 11S02629-2 TaxID=1476195 RepID=UPI000BA52938|nr:hypothetical protein [Helicobacter sp. 11S02629-2]PAF44099.1 hypothetical protein BKH40_06420 [Helicobacter sp. 11S02629-2]
MKTNKLRYSFLLAFLCAFIFVACSTHKDKENSFSFAPLSTSANSEASILNIAIQKTKFDISTSSPSASDTKTQSKDSKQKVTLIYYMPSECLSCASSLVHLDTLSKNVPLLDIKVVASSKLKAALQDDYTGKLPIYIDTSSEDLEAKTKESSSKKPLEKKDFINVLGTNLGIEIKPDEPFFVLLDKEHQAVKSYEGIILEENLELDSRALVAR